MARYLMNITALTVSTHSTCSECTCLVDLALKTIFVIEMLQGTENSIVLMISSVLSFSLIFPNPV